MSDSTEKVVAAVTSMKVMRTHADFVDDRKAARRSDSHQECSYTAPSSPASLQVAVIVNPCNLNNRLVRFWVDFLSVDEENEARVGNPKLLGVFRGGSEQYLTSGGLLVSNNNCMHSRRRSFLDQSEEAVVVVSAAMDDSAWSSGRKSLGIASVASTVKISNAQTPTTSKKLLRRLQQSSSSTTTIGPNESTTNTGSHQQYTAPKVWGKLKRLVRGNVKPSPEEKEHHPHHSVTAVPPALPLLASATAHTSFPRSIAVTLVLLRPP
jgi:hypothetical protein